jgi:hypothetical protein
VKRVFADAAIGATVAGYRRARSLPSAKSEWIVVNADQGGGSSSLGSGATHLAQFATTTNRTLYHLPAVLGTRRHAAGISNRNRVQRQSSLHRHTAARDECARPRLPASQRSYPQDPRPRAGSFLTTAPRAPRNGGGTARFSYCGIFSPIVATAERVD